MKTIKIGDTGPLVVSLQKALKVTADGKFGRVTEAALRKWQAARHLVADGVCGNQTWNALGGGIGRLVDEIIVHCSATPEGRHVNVFEIRQWHLKRGFNDIGYHYVVYLDGSVHEGRDIKKAGAHCTGHNAHSVGVCYVGGCGRDGVTPKDTRTEAQRIALRELLHTLRERFPLASIHGHREFAAKACPCFDAAKEYQDL